MLDAAGVPDPAMYEAVGPLWFVGGILLLIAAGWLIDRWQNRG